MDESPSSPPLAPYVEEVLETLVAQAEETSDPGLPRTDVETHLETVGFERPTIETALDQLLNRGYIYEVHDQIRLTDPHRNS